VRAYASPSDNHSGYSPEPANIHRELRMLLNRLESILTKRSASIDFKRLTELLNSLESTITKGNYPLKTSRGCLTLPREQHFRYQPPEDAEL